MSEASGALSLIDSRLLIVFFFCVHRRPIHGTCLFVVIIGRIRFDALYIVPVFQSFWILISVLAGLVFFGEYAEMDDTQVAMFPVGIVLTVIGVYFLSLRGVDECTFDRSGLVARLLSNASCSRSSATPPHLSKSSETSGNLTVFVLSLLLQCLSLSGSFHSGRCG